MLQDTNDLYGNPIAAADGEVGTLKDFYFDDKRWVIRYLIAATSGWLSGREVLLSPRSFCENGPLGEGLRVELQRKQIQDSAAIEPHILVSRQYKTDFSRFYGLPAYWNAGAAPVSEPRFAEAFETRLQRHRQIDNHLQSAKALNGFHIKALDGRAGIVRGFLVDDRSWSIPALIAETGHWYSEREILISPNNVNRICYEQATVFVNLTRSNVQRTPRSRLAGTGLSDDGVLHSGVKSNERSWATTTSERPTPQRYRK